jgi:hypothetical protein
MGPTQINKRNGHPDKSHNRSEIKKKKHKNFNLKWRLGRCCSDRPRYSILNFPMVGLAGGSDYSAQRNSKPHSDTSPEIQGIKNPKGHPGPQVLTLPTGVGDKWCDVKRDMPGQSILVPHIWPCAIRHPRGFSHPAMHRLPGTGCVRFLWLSFAIQPENLPSDAHSMYLCP